MLLVPLNLHESFAEKRGETPSAVIKFAVAGRSARGEDGSDLIYFLLSILHAYHFDACFEVAVSRLKLMHSLSTPLDRFLYCAW